MLQNQYYHKFQNRAELYSSPSARASHAAINKGQKGLYVFDNCILIITSEEEHSQLRIYGVAFCCIVQLTVTLKKYEEYKRYILEVLKIDNITIDFYPNTDTAIVTINEGNVRRNLFNFIEHWLPTNGPIYDILSNHFWTEALYKLPNLILRMRFVYDCDRNEIQCISPISVLKKTLIPFRIIIYGLFRDTNVTCYITQLTMDLPVQIKYAQKLNLPLSGLFSSGKGETKWKKDKEHVRYVLDPIHFNLLIL